MYFQDISAQGTSSLFDDYWYAIKRTFEEREQRLVLSSFFCSFTLLFSFGKL